MNDRTPLWSSTIWSASILALGAALLLPAPAAADAPNGRYLFELGGPNQIVVVSGDADLSSLFLFPFLCEDFRTNPKGIVNAECDVNIPGFGNLDGRVKGGIDRSKDRTTLTQKLRLKGAVRASGRKFKLDYLYTIRAVLADEADNVRYTWKVRACVENGSKNCSKARDTISIPAIGFSDLAVIATNWTLALNVSTNAKNKIKGTATIQTDEGQTINMKVKGKYNPRTDLSDMKLTRKGSSVRLIKTDVTGDVMTTTIRHNIFGNLNSFMAVSTTP